MLENMTTGEKVIAGATAVGIAALIFHKPTRNAVGLSDGKKRKMITPISMEYDFKNNKGYKTFTVSFDDGEIFSRTYKNIDAYEARKRFEKAVKSKLK